MSVIIAIITITIIPIASPEILAQTDDFTEVIRERNDDKTRDNPDKIIKTPDFVFEGQTEGWAFVENETHKAFLSLDGDAIFNSKNNFWKVKSNSEISIGETNAKIELKGKVKDSKLRLNGSGELEDGTPFRIILRGYFVPIEKLQIQIEDMVVLLQQLSDRLSALEQKVDEQQIIISKLESRVPVDCSQRGPGVDLRHCDLSFTDLTNAKLNGANLSVADLTNATLTNANLIDVILFYRPH